MPVNSFEDYPMSWRPSLPRSKQPLYLALAELLQQDIASGALLPGTKLPPQRELADFLDINVSTITRAFKICSDKGLLSSVMGSGTFVSYDVNTSTLVIPQGGPAPRIEFGSMMPETMPQKEAVAMLQKMLSESECKNLFQYSYHDEQRYKEAAAKLLTRLGLSVTDPHRILFASGGQNAMAAVFAGLFRPGEKLGVDPLIYPGIKGAAKLFGIHLVPIRQENGEISRSGLLAACKNDGIKGLYIMPDFQNPTNHTMTLPCRRMVAETAREFGLMVIEDGISSLLAAKPLPPVSALAPEQCIFLLSLSKTVLPALRLAYLHVPERWAAALEQALYHLNLSQSSLLLELAARLILSGSLESLLAERKKGILLRNRLANEILQGYTLLGGEECLSRWLLLPGNTSGQAFEAMALEKGLSVYGSHRFAVGRETPVAAARIAVCSPETPEELENGLRLLKKLLDTL